MNGPNGVDHAATLTAVGTVPVATAPRPGTLLFTSPIDGIPEIFVVGTDNQLHGFATPKQFESEGYDGALVVTVMPGYGGLAIGQPVGTDLSSYNALATSSDGAIVVDSSGNSFVFAGGMAFPITGSASLGAIRKTDQAEALNGSPSLAQQSGEIADGVVLSAPGLDYVSYGGELYTFKGPQQLDRDGYAGTAAAPDQGAAA